MDDFLGWMSLQSSNQQLQNTEKCIPLYYNTTVFILSQSVLVAKPPDSFTLGNWVKPG